MAQKWKPRLDRLCTVLGHHYHLKKWLYRILDSTILSGLGGPEDPPLVALLLPCTKFYKFLAAKYNKGSFLALLNVKPSRSYKNRNPSKVTIEWLLGKYK